jgi:hypothetical protein
MNIKMQSPPRISRSSIPAAGNGIFATRDYEKGEWICFYDGDDIPNEEIICENYSQEYLHDNVNDKGQSRLGYKIPRHKYGVAQLVNDAEMIHYSDDYPINIDDISSALKKYIYKSEMTANTTINEDWGLYATRPIYAGEELFYFYGPTYWIGHCCRHSTSIPHIKAYNTVLRFYNEENKFV